MFSETPEGYLSKRVIELAKEDLFSKSLTKRFSAYFFLMGKDKDLFASFAELDSDELKELAIKHSPLVKIKCKEIKK